MTKTKQKKTKTTQALIKKALKDKPKWKPAKGYKYLKDLKIGSLFTTERKTRGVLIDCNTNAIVIITSSPNTRPEDNNFYLGKKTISDHTEVKEIR